MRISMHGWKVGCLTLTGFIIAGGLYQNCAKVQVEDIASSSPVAPLTVDDPRPSQFSKIQVGTSELADLKMLFVVDNSYSMKQSNINLAASFETLFNSQNSDNLTKFPVSSFLLTVGQKTPDATLADQTRIQALLAWQKSQTGIVPSALADARTAVNLGRLAGDSIGYQVTKTGSSYSFAPASVIGLGPGGVIKKNISKDKNESAVALVKDFKDRMSLLQDVSLTNYTANKDILDAESGLCAIARILKDPSYFTAGDMAVINVFTDENDSDEAGLKCLAGYNYSEGDTDLHNGMCETRKTVFNYKYDVQKGAECTYNYKDTFSYKLYHTGKQWNSSVSYYKISTYKCDQTKLDFKEVNAWKKKKTKIKVTYKYFQLVDGSKVYDADLKSSEYWMDGYLTPALCKVDAQSKYNSAGKEYVSDLCTNSDEVVASCSYSDSNCIVAGSLDKSFTFSGDFVSSCSTQAANRSSAVVPGTPSCALTGSLGTSASQLPGCTAVIGVSPISSTGIREDLGTKAACDAKAGALGGYVSEAHPATCISKQDDAGTSKTGNLYFSDYPEISPATAVSFACSEAVKAKAILNAGVSPGVVTDCKIESSPLRASVAAKTSSCEAQSATFCASNAKYVSCVLLKETAASKVPTLAALQANEVLSCSSKCKDTKTSVCVANGNLPVVDPEMTIADYLTQAKLSTVACAASAPVQLAKVSDFSAKTLDQIASICPVSSGGNPVYSKIEGASYRYKGFAPEFISGNKIEAGKLVPDTDLPTFIGQKVQAIFGEQKPIVNVFIRKSGDDLGEAGSRGTAYELLETILGAKVYSVLSTDYSPALKDLAAVVNSKMLRTFKVPSMAGTQKVVSVIWKSKAASRPIKLSDAQWSQSGTSVQIVESVPMQIGDEIEFEYK